MTIDQLRRLKTLSEMPTHSEESLEALKELVKDVTIVALLERTIDGAGYICQNCVFDDKCKDILRMSQTCYRNGYNGFELKMGDDENA